MFMYIKRDIEKHLLAQLNSNDSSIILLSGARQTGKTTIINNLKTEKEKLIINLWDEENIIKVLKEADTFSKFETYLNTFFNFKPDGSKILFIDEAQASQHLGLFLMQMHREWKKQKVVLLGSILSNLFTVNVPMPTGRTVEFVCRPLNFREFLKFSGKENYLDAIDFLNFDENIHKILLAEYETFMQIGGMPGIVNTYIQKNNLYLVYESLLNNIYKDADRFISNFKDLNRSRTIQYGSLAEHCLKTIANLVAFPSTNSSILSTNSPSYRDILPTVLEALQMWHLVYYIKNETKEPTTKKGYNSKKYIFDTGIMNFISNKMLPVSLDSDSKISAKLLENIILQELITYTGSIKNITSYKTNNKVVNELDFLVNIKGKIIPIEVKCSSKINSKALSQVLSYLKNSSTVNHAVVICNSKPQEKEIENYKVHFIPPYLLGKFIEEKVDKL